MDSMCPPLPVTMSPMLSTATSSTVQSTRTDLPVPSNSTDPGTSTHDHVSPLISMPMGATNEKSRAWGHVGHRTCRTACSVGHEKCPLAAAGAKGLEWLRRASIP